MPRKGPQRRKLEQYLHGADPDAISKMGSSLGKYAKALGNAALEVELAADRIKKDLSGEMPVAAQTSMRTSSHHMHDRGGSVTPAQTSLQTAAQSMSMAITALSTMGDVPDDPPPADQSTDEGIRQQAANQVTINQNQAAYEAQEQQAAELTAQLDTDNQAAVEELKKIHGIPDPPPASSGGGSPQGPGGGNPYAGMGGPGDGTKLGPGGTAVSDPFPVRNPQPFVPPVLVHPEDPDVVHNTNDDNVSNDDGYGFGGYTNGGDGSDGFDGSDGYDGSSDGTFEGVTADGSGTSGHSLLGGGFSGAATAGIIGGAGVGIGAMGLAGRAIAGRGVPGLAGGGRIGATARTAGSAVTGRRGAAGAGAGSRSARAAAKAGAGAAGTKGAKGGAGGRGGAGAGAGGRGKGKKDRTKGSVWDGVEDGDQWLEDDNAAGSVLD